MPTIDEEDAKAYCLEKPKFSEWKLIGAVILAVLLVFTLVLSANKDVSVKMVSYYPESVTIEQGKQKITVDGAQMTKFVLSGVRVIVNGDTLKNVKCEMVKVN